METLEQVIARRIEAMKRQIELSKEILTNEGGK